MNNDISKTGTDNKKERNMSTSTNTESIHSTTNAGRRRLRNRERGKNAPSTKKMEAGRPQAGELIIESEASAQSPKSIPYGRMATNKERFDFETPYQWNLVEGGQQALGLSSVSQLLDILRVCDLKRQWVEGAMAIDGFRPYTSVCAVNDSILIFEKDSFDVIEVRLKDWRRQPTKSLGHLFLPNERIENVVMLPGTRRVWVDTCLYIHDKKKVIQEVGITRLIDLDEERVLRAFFGLGRASLVVGSEPQRIFRNGYGRKSRIWSADGSSSIELEETPGWAISKVTVGISGEGLLAARRLAARDRHGVELVAFDATGALHCRTELPDCEEVTEMFTFPAGGHTLVRTRDVGTDDGRLLWFRHAGNRLVLEAVHDVPAGVVLIQDQSCGSAAYVVPCEGGFGMGAIDPVHGIEPQDEGEV